MGHLLCLGTVRGGKGQIHGTCGPGGTNRHAGVSTRCWWHMVQAGAGSGLGGGFSAVCVQSRRQEGAERDGRVCKPIGSWRSQERRGKGAACLVIALINQARSEQDPTLSTPRSGLCHPHQRQVLCHPPPQQCHHPLLSHVPVGPSSQVCSQGVSLVISPSPSDSEGHIWGHPGCAALGLDDFVERRRAVTCWFLAVGSQ